MPTISIITAVAPDALDHFADAIASVECQTVPVGWSIEWIVCVDGADMIKLPFSDTGGRRVQVVCAGRRLGPGGCRNIAALYAQGTILRNLDADDILLPGALQQDIQTLEGHRDLGWTTSEALDLMPDGSRVTFTTATANRPIPIGYVGRQWSRQPILDIHPATLAIRRDVFWSAGGYAALPMSEDVVLLGRANTVAAGLHRASPTLLYRKWQGQMTSAPKPAAYERIRELFSGELLRAQQGGE